MDQLNLHLKRKMNKMDPTVSSMLRFHTVVTSDLLPPPPNLQVRLDHFKLGHEYFRGIEESGGLPEGCMEAADQNKLNTSGGFKQEQRAARRTAAAPRPIPGYFSQYLSFQQRPRSPESIFFLFSCRREWERPPAVWLIFAARNCLQSF